MRSISKSEREALFEIFIVLEKRESFAKRSHTHMRKLIAAVGRLLLARKPFLKTRL